jgi:hypothetical protein
MINPSQIPDEVVEAAARAIADTDCPASLFLTCESHHGGCMCRDQARAVLAAGLAAWPGAYAANQVQAERPPVLCLPFPQEARDD